MSSPNKFSREVTMRAHRSIATVGYVLMTALVWSPAQLHADVGIKGSSATQDDLMRQPGAIRWVQQLPRACQQRTRNVRSNR